MIDHKTRLHEYGSNGNVNIETYSSVRVRMTTEDVDVEQAYFRIGKYKGLPTD
jgi:hypothetical protein